MNSQYRQQGRILVVGLLLRRLAEYSIFGCRCRRRRQQPVRNDSLWRRAAAASNRPLPGAVAALFLYHRYFIRGKTPLGERLSRFAPRDSTRDFTATRIRLDAALAVPVLRAFARFGDNYKRMNELSKDSVSWLTVDEDAAGQRIDNFLLRVLKGVPKSHIYRIVRSGEVRVNKGRVGPDRRLAPGDVLRIPPTRAARSGAARVGAPVARAFTPAILLEDDWLLAVDKPAGLAVHGGSGIALGLIEQLRASRPHARALELVHRLDRDTSGVLLIAKKRAALTALHAQLRDGHVDKRYRVLVRGPWREARRVVDVPLHKFVTREGERRVRIEPGGRESITVFRREKTWASHDPPLALLEAQLETGRTHQIRVHLAHLGHALAGDDKYGDFAWNRQLAREGLKRMFLHAAQLTFRHPVSGETLQIASPLPEELSRFLDSLG
jgi:23S rRNA pseudouridine955/2504/2580 synthase